MHSIRTNHFARILVILAASLPAAAQQASVSAVLSESAGLWLVELASPPVADGGSAAAAQQDKQRFRASAQRQGVALEERFAYDVLFNGLSVRASGATASQLASLDRVKAVYPVLIYAAPDPPAAADPNLATALAQTGADIAQTELGYTGAGVRVGVIDSGVDYHHPDLGGCFGAGCRVGWGYDFVGDAYNSTGTGSQLVPVPDPNPDDCGGHGTHVAGIVGAMGVVKGVAPGVRFGAYRVFGCSGTSASDVIVAAMERALADGMQVVNMSLGAARQWPQYPTAAAATRLVNSGVVVVASQGNDAGQGLYAGGAPSLGQKVIAVASFDNTYANLAAFSVSPDGQPIGYTNATAAPPAPLSGSSPMSRTGTATSTADACAALPAGSLAGTVALIRRGTCGFYQKARNAQLAGAIGVVLYNNVAGRVSPTVAGTPAVTIPVVAVSAAEGVLINGRLASGAVTMTWTSGTLSEPQPTGNLISSFSSWGPSPDLKLKPDVGAPGGFIRSTVPIELGSYGLNSGTSMASPHVAGAVALLLEARPSTPSQAVNAMLQNSADPKPFSANPAAGLEPVHRQGAGMLDIDDAILATTKIEPGKLSLGESEAGPATHTLTLHNSASMAVTYDLSHAPALATGPNTFTVGTSNAPANVSFGSPSVTIPPGGSADVMVTISPNASLADKSLYGGYVVFTPQGGGRAYRVPYSGFKGNYQSIAAIVPTAAGFPWLAKLSGTTFLNQPAGATYTLAGGDVPYFLMHLDHQVRRLRAEVFDAVSGRSWHRMLNEEYVPRNSSATAFFSFAWDGGTFHGNQTGPVPNGAYVVKFTVEKALGDSGNPAHIETWTSPIVTIARP